MDGDAALVAQWLRTVMRDLDLPQAELARRAGLRPDELTRILNGVKVKRVLARIWDIADATGARLPARLDDIAARYTSGRRDTGGVADEISVERRRAHLFGFLQETLGTIPRPLPALDAVPTFRPGSRNFLAAVTSADRKMGAHDLLMNGLSEVTFPLEVLVERTEALVWELGPSNAAEAFRRYHELSLRWSAFREELRTNRCRHLCPRTAIEEYAEHGVFPRDDALNWAQVNFATPSQRITHLESLIKLLGNHNYYLGLLRDSQTVERVDYLVKHQYAVYGEYYPKNGGHSALMIGDPRIVEAFRDRFDVLWHDTTRAETNKRWVTDWLREKLERLKANASASRTDELTP